MISQYHWQTFARSILSHLCVNTVELPRPRDIVQELSHVKAVIVGAVHLRMTAGSQCRHLVSVHRIGTEKVLHLLSNLYEKSIFIFMSFI